MSSFPKSFNTILIINYIVIVSSSDLSKLSTISAAFGGSSTFGINDNHRTSKATKVNKVSTLDRQDTAKDYLSTDYDVFDKNIINDFFSDQSLLWDNDDIDEDGLDMDDLQSWQSSEWLDDHDWLDDNEPSRYSMSDETKSSSDMDDGSNWSEEYGPRSEKGQLYEAYNLLHRLAQDFEKPFDAPAVLVVGHQSSGKSALIEALIGFQYNQVGGGTKTRRPIALKMQYNPRYSTPKCYLKDDSGEEIEKSLEDIKRYVEAENQRLEQSAVKNFDAREIHIRMEYKYCPNMILIDTPGLISAPRAKKANAHHRALIASAREVESLVLSKIACEDYIIVCVEDTNDWKHGVTRQVVQKVDVDLSRTVIVNTKLDTKIPQFTSNSDVHSFLAAEIVDEISPYKLAGPFFTSVPAGRVGMGREDSFRSNAEFVKACKDVEDRDKHIVEERLSKLRSSASDRHDLLSRVGMNKLREYLEQKVDERYRSNVQKMIPLLKAEHDTTLKKLEGVTQELHFLNQDNLKCSAYSYCDDFTSALRDAIQGSIVAPSNEFGQSLDKEHTLLGSFHDAPNCHMAIPSSLYCQLLHNEVGQTQHRLYGGSAYHRVIREFDFASRCLRLPAITPDEIANAAGMGEHHDGVDLLRAACIISLTKAKLTFDPLVLALNSRLKHVMVQLFPVVDYVVGYKYEQRSNNSKDGMDISHSPLFKQWIHDVFNKFVNQCSDSAMARCHDDITALTRFITWDIKDAAGPAMLARSLPDETDAVGIYKVAVESTNKKTDDESKKNKGRKKKNKEEQSVGKEIVTSSDSISTEQYTDLVHLMEEQYSGMLTRNEPDRTDTLINHLVQHIVSQWRTNFCKSTIQKLNCYFLMPFLDEFNKYIRMQLDKVDMDEFLELSYMKNKLVKKREELLRESEQNKILQEKFINLQKTMKMMTDDIGQKKISEDKDTLESSFDNTMNELYSGSMR